MRNVAALLILTGSITILGCGSNDVPEPSGPTAPPAANGHSTPTNTTEVKADGVTLEIKSWDETLAVVAEQKGKIVVLDLWSTSCQPCMDEFPHLVELHKQYGGDKLICLSANCDYIGLKNKLPETYKANVLEFLGKQQATFPNVLLNIESDALFDQIKLASIPAVFVFGFDGQVAKRFDNDNSKQGEDFTYQKNIVPFVESLLTQ